MYYFVHLNQTQVHQIFHIKEPGLCCIFALISQEMRDFHYRPAFVFHWPQNVYCICVLPDLQAATWDNIFPWIKARLQYRRLREDLRCRWETAVKKKRRKCWIAKRTWRGHGNNFVLCCWIPVFVLLYSVTEWTQVFTCRTWFTCLLAEPGATETQKPSSNLWHSKMKERAWKKREFTLLFFKGRCCTFLPR